MPDLPKAVRTCPRPGCDTVIRSTAYCCPPDWYGLPLSIRNAISRAWRTGGQGVLAVLTPAYRDATDRAMAHWQASDV